MKTHTSLRFSAFLGISYVTAAFFEGLANTVGDGKLFSNPAWPLYFLAWYGGIYTALFTFFSRRPIWQGVAAFAIFGVAAEVIVFHRHNWIVDPCIYAAMALVPLWAHQKLLK